MISRKAFTLIELLVVIAIIAILAAILFPVFAQAKAAAKATAGLSNQKQVGLSWIMYAGDSDDQTPPGARGFSITELTFQSWWSTYYLPSYSINPAKADTYDATGTVSPYIKSEGITHDPQVNLKQPSFWYIPFGVNGSIYALPFSSKGGPRFTPLDFGVNPNAIKSSLTEFSQPAETILFSDAAYFDASSGTVAETSVSDGNFRGNTGFDKYTLPFAHARKSGRANVAWVDGHAKSAVVTPHDYDYYAATAAQLKTLGLGDILKPGASPSDPTTRYYYYAKSGAISTAAGALVK